MDDRAPADGETVRTQRRYNRQAATYDITEVPAEFLLFGRLRRRLWRSMASMEGRVLEVGVGTGKNVQHYPAGASVVTIDLSPAMVSRARTKADRQKRHVDFVVADAQHLPFRNAAFDSAAATFVFCSVPDAVAGLREVARVTRGRVHLLEHVRAANPVAGKAMDLLNPLVVRISGANINRDTVRNVRNSGIEIEDVESRGLGLVKLITGLAHGASGKAPAEELQTAV